MKKTLALFALFAMALIAAAPAHAREPARIGIAAVVNDDVVTLSDLRNRIALYTSGMPAPASEAERNKIRAQVLARLIDEKLQMQEAATLGITVGDDMVMSGFSEIASQNKLPADEFRKRLSASGVNVTTLYDQIRAEIAWSQVVKRKLRPQVNISESEIDTELTQIERTGGRPEYLVAEIFLPVPSAPEETEVRQKAEAIIAALKKGVPFSKIARETSQSPGASTGGDIGWVTQGQLANALDEALQKLQPGQVSPPVRGDKGYHVLFLRNTRQRGMPAPDAAPAAAAQETPDVVPVDILTALELKQIMIPITANEPAAVMNAKVVRAETLREEIKGCDAMDARMKDFPSDGTGHLGKIKVEDMPAPMQQAVDGLADGTLSRPVRTQDGLAVVMICGRETVPGTAPAPKPAPVAAAPAPANNEVNREEIATKLGMERLNQMQDRYLKDLRAAAFIDKRI